MSGIKSKYNNRKTHYSGLEFDSKVEFERYLELIDMKKRGVIDWLALQPRYELMCGFHYVDFSGKKRQARKMEYVADFSYVICESGLEVVEDVKGYQTDVYKLKKKLFLHRYISGQEGMRRFCEVKMTNNDRFFK